MQRHEPAYTKCEGCVLEIRIGNLQGVWGAAAACTYKRKCK